MCSATRRDIHDPLYTTACDSAAVVLHYCPLTTASASTDSAAIHNTQTILYTSVKIKDFRRKMYRKNVLKNSLLSNQT